MNLYASLKPLTGFQVPVYASLAVESHARKLAARFERAYQFLMTRLEIPQ